MISETMRKELENEFKGLKTVETLSPSFIKGIKVKGYRLSQSEKETLAFHYLNYGLDLNNTVECSEIIETDREIERDIKETEKKVKQFEKTLSRLNDEDMTGYVHDNDYYEVEVILEGIDYMGASEYAKYWFRTRF